MKIKLIIRIRLCILISLVISVIWLLVELHAQSNIQNDGAIINYAGRLRYLTYKAGAHVVIKRNYSEYYPVLNNKETPINEIISISSSLLGETDVIDIPHIHDDDVKYLLNNWVDKIKLFDNKYISIDQQQLTVKNMVTMFFDVDLLVKVLNQILKRLEYMTYHKIQHLIYINIFRVLTISFFNMISVFTFSQLIEPYIKLHEEQNEIKEIVNNQSEIIKEQEVIITEHETGCVGELPQPIPNIPISICRTTDQVSDTTSNHTNATIYGMQSVSEDGIIPGFFDGYWTIIPTKTSSTVCKWLNEITINGDNVIDGVQKSVKLQIRNKTVYFEGGILYFIDVDNDILCRVGKSNNTLYWSRKNLIDKK